MVLTIHLQWLYFFSFTLYVFVPICPCNLSYCHIFLLTWVIGVTCLVRGHLEAFFMDELAIHQSLQMLMWTIFTMKTPRGALESKESSLAFMRRQESSPMPAFWVCLSAGMRRWWMTDTTLKCLLSFRIILPIFR